MTFRFTPKVGTKVKAGPGLSSYRFIKDNIYTVTHLTAATAEIEPKCGHCIPIHSSGESFCKEFGDLDYWELVEDGPIVAVLSPGSKIEVPCKTDTCRRPNYTDAKACWWCGTPV